MGKGFSVSLSLEEAAVVEKEAKIGWVYPPPASFA
jgi:hypothetical protein